MAMSVLIVPGLGGSEENHWQTHLERSLPGAARVEQDDWDNPWPSQWLERLANAVVARPGALIVAHSLGCPLVAHLAVRRPGLCIAGALLVAPADVDSARHTPSRVRNFAPVPREPLPFPSIVVGSTNDPFIKIERARELAADWNSIFVDAGACGHINVASGFGRWRAVERLIERLATVAGVARPATLVSAGGSC